MILSSEVSNGPLEDSGAFKICPKESGTTFGNLEGAVLGASVFKYHVLALRIHANNRTAILSI